MRDVFFMLTVGTTESSNAQNDSDHQIQGLLPGADHIPALINGSPWPMQEEETRPHRESNSRGRKRPRRHSEWLEDAMTDM